MAKIAIGFGVALIVLGLAGFLPNRAMTALIPAYVGAGLTLCGVAALKTSVRKLAMHIAVAIALLAFLATSWRLVVALTGDATPSTLALIVQGGTALLTGIFVSLCVRSFIAARRGAPTVA